MQKPLIGIIFYVDFNVDEEPPLDKARSPTKTPLGDREDGAKAS